MFALSTPSRVRILSHLRQRPHTVTEYERADTLISTAVMILAAAAVMLACGWAFSGVERDDGAERALDVPDVRAIEHAPALLALVLIAFGMHELAHNAILAAVAVGAALIGAGLRVWLVRRRLRRIASRRSRRHRETIGH